MGSVIIDKKLIEKANIDDGSCIIKKEDYTYKKASNYDDKATKENATCKFNYYYNNLVQKNNHLKNLIFTNLIAIISVVIFYIYKILSLIR